MPARNQSVYVTFDHISSQTGAGLVCLHEINALKSVTELQFVICRSSPDLGVHVKNLNLDRLYMFNPFLYDYFAAETISQDRPSEKIALAHLSCSPANAIIRELDPERYVCNVVAHELKDSVEEHERYYGVGSYPFRHNTDPWLHNILLHQARMADKVICPSSKSADWIRRNVRSDVENIVVIPHGVNMPHSIQPLPNVFKAGYLGAFGPDKGLVYLVKAWSNLALDDAEMVFAGDCSLAIPSLIGSLPKTTARFRTLGRVQDACDFYSSVSVYVQPSVTEAFGIPALEAMAAGRPVIVSMGAGASDCVRDGIDGFVIPPRSPEAIMEKLTYFKDNPDEVRKMGNNAKQRASAFTWQEVERMYVDLYQSLLD